MTHIPVPIPQALHRFLEGGATGETIPALVGTNKPMQYMPPATASFPTASPRIIPAPVSLRNVPIKKPAATVATVAGLDILEEISTPEKPAAPTKPPAPAPVPAPAPAPSITTPSKIPLFEAPQAAMPGTQSKKEEFMDVLEEADKEFESFIDKLIEE